MTTFPSLSGRRVIVCTLSGMGTSLDFMDEFRAVLVRELGLLGAEASELSLYPYGDWSRRLVPQLLEIGLDLSPGGSRLWPAVGVGRVLHRLLPEAQAGHTLLLIGHSGGGVTALQAAAKLADAGCTAPLVVQIGSPKVPVRADLRPRTLYMYYADEAGRRKDPVSRLGTWGLSWNLRAGKTPGRIVRIPLIGGHPDYFRHHAPYIDPQGRTNLERLLEPLMSWLTGKLLT